MTNARADEAFIIIRGRGRVSALGEQAFPASSDSPFSTHPNGLPVATLPPATEAAVAELRRAHPAYRQLDRTVLLAILAARQAATDAGWNHDQQPTTYNQHALTVSIGSSRGATHHLEQYHEEFLREGSVPAAASPLTTLGNVASWVAFDAGSADGAALSHSSTCSSAFQALGNAVAWLRAGMADRYLAGGAEAPLTEFTLAQMQAIGIYSPFAAGTWPCRPGAGRPSTFTLGEGAAVFALERVAATTATTEAAATHQPLFRLESVGFGFEAIGSKTGISADGQHFQKAMRQALQQAGRELHEVDALVLHSPGTPAGDAAELAAVQTVFSGSPPLLLSNKWLVGHTLGASAALSLDFALQILATQQWPVAPFPTYLATAPKQPIRRILVNAAGFGGNAASALVSLV
ncbi:beta-ketoacyl-ACP reductase [Hymenobacter aerilatus]|uniref:Beta-ketoacyl-ACP reductase n=1 Tax=Hymenobacter aerilatus TaxID=2932251 RepID=A0A8T9SXR1_9BACT|nr:beta-ketoacyl synthase N-terminal-like domain-containing protein [Hymenobacter aerilatus]UOR06171.1 beta-ketoacyl-ACP reductase [Hymenobacter aerilatus]